MRGDEGARMANAMAVVAGRATRLCDVCARKRSRWYCAADAAYLCEGCDSSVHPANALESDHQRVRLTPNGNPMKMDRHNSEHHQRKLKGGPSSNAGHSAFSSVPQHAGCFQGSCGTFVMDKAPDRFVAEEVSDNTSLRFHVAQPVCPPLCYESSSTAPGDPNNLSESNNCGTNSSAHEFVSSTASSGGGGEAVDQYDAFQARECVN